MAIVDDGRQHQEIAAAAGLAPQTLSGILTGRIRDPRRATRAAIAAVLGRPESELFPEHAPAGAVNDDDLAAKVRSDRIAQGLSPDPTDEQMDFVGAVIVDDMRRRKADDTPPELTDAQMDFIGAVVYSDLRRQKEAAAGRIWPRPKPLPVVATPPPTPKPVKPTADEKAMRAIVRALVDNLGRECVLRLIYEIEVTA